MADRRTAPVLALLFFATLASPLSASLLSDRFGVTLRLGAGQYDTKQNKVTYPFDRSSFVPTKNLATVDYVEGDWYGYWKLNGSSSQTVHGPWVSGGEPYDTEAIYLDNDGQNLYVAIVTSFSSPPGQTVGGTLLVTGDIALDLGLNAPAGDGFRYDFGVDVNQEVRPIGGGDAASGGSDLGTGVYRTTNGDWYLGSPSRAVGAGGERTNFDPNDWCFSGSYLGEAAVEYYLYEFPGGLEEGGWPTYIIEATIPVALLGVTMTDGMPIGISWSAGCRNDGASGNVLCLTGDWDSPPAGGAGTQAASPGIIPEPTTLLLVGLGPAGLLLRRWSAYRGAAA